MLSISRPRVVATYALHARNRRQPLESRPGACTTRWPACGGARRARASWSAPPPQVPQGGGPDCRWGGVRRMLSVLAIAVVLATVGVVVAHRTSCHPGSLSCPVKMAPDDTIPKDHFLDEPLPLESQPPNPCYLLTAREAIAAVGAGHLAGIGPPNQLPQATPRKPTRSCDWDVPYAVNRDQNVTVTVMTAAANSAARAAFARASEDPSSDVPALPVAFAKDASSAQDLTVLGYPAHYWTPGGLGVLTPTALVQIGGGTDEAATVKLGELALRRLNTMCPCAEPAPAALPIGSQPPNPCHLVTEQEMAAAFDINFVDAAGRFPAQFVSPARLADFTSGEGRTCYWALTAPHSGVVMVNIVTSASQAAINAARGGVPTVPVLYAEAGVPGDAQLTVLGDPAQYYGGDPRTSDVAVLWVLAGDTLLTVTEAGPPDFDETTLTEVAELALGRLKSTGP